MLSARRTVAIVVAGLAGAGLAGCGLAACGSSSPPPVPAGHATPAAAATGFLEAASAGHIDVACGYVVPTQASVCTSAFTSGGAFSVADLHTGHVSVAGDRALVTALGRLCTGTTSKQCFTSSDASAGQPSGDLSFDAAYDAVENGTASDPNDPAVPCQLVSGSWYVDLGQAATPAA